MSSMDVSSDEILRATDDDAAISRLSSVHQNYLEDPFSTFFVSASMQPTRRSPLINRGTYLRIYSIDQVMRAFLEGFPKGSRQIVNLGAGTDTRYFRFKKFHSDLLQQVKYFEIDFEETILHKISIIRKRKVLSQLLTQVRYEGTHLVSEDYCLIPGDLRDWTTVLTSLESVGYDSSLPTLFISECVFIYIQPKYVDHLIQWIGQLPCSIFVCYEQILPDDAFGSMMLKNLKTRDIYLPGINVTPTLEAHTKRLETYFTDLFVMDMNTFWSKHVSEEEKQRITKLEIFDEIEEWQLISKHYCFVLAIKNYSLVGWST